MLLEGLFQTGSHGDDSTSSAFWGTDLLHCVGVALLDSQLAFYEVKVFPTEREQLSKSQARMQATEKEGIPVRFQLNSLL